MPEMLFRVRWPDFTETTHYSPSLVIEDHLSPGATYDIPDFLERARGALTIASERVQAKYGMPCSRALAQRADIERRCADVGTGLVTVLAFHRPDQEAAP